MSTVQTTVHPAPPSSRLAFPAGFLWGAATAAHQVEGNNVASDWWVRETLPDPTIAEPSGDACDSYHRFGEDIALLADAGLDTYRFSVEWARIEPARGMFSRAELDHYRRMVDACLERGVTPALTLHHFTLPQWLAAEGGWRSPEAVDRFARYVAAVRPILVDVPWVFTINEPNMVAIMASRGGAWPTAGLPDPDPEVAETLLLAHRAARAELDGTGARTGWTVATQDVQALPGVTEEATRAAGVAADRYRRAVETWFLEGSAGDDFVGVQAYTRTLVDAEGPRPVDPAARRTLTGWEYYPPAAAHGVAQAVLHAPGTPVLITENGVATDDDTVRVDYLRRSLGAVHAAIDEGAPVRGFLAWSLLDNYEWGSFAPTFGLVGVDRTTFERHPRPSLAWLGSVARANAVDTPAAAQAVAGPAS